MDVDQPSSSSHPSVSNINAVAGPSHHTDIPVVFKNEGLARSRRPLFDSTQDLLTRFQLLPAYDKYVRRHIHTNSVIEGGFSSAPQTPKAALFTAGVVPTASQASLDKGKGKEILVESQTPPGLPALDRTGNPDAGDGDEDENGEKGEKKKKNSYKHLIKGLPGKHSTKKDDYLQNIMQIPPKQKMNIIKFDARTQREAFAVSLEGLKGWNINALVAESAQAREDRKKRKELKRLSKIHVTGSLNGPGSQPPSALSPSTNLPNVVLGTAGAAVTPSASISAPTPTPNLVQTHASRQPGTPSSMGVGTPRPAPILQQRSGSKAPTTPLGTNSSSIAQHLPSGRPASTPLAASATRPSAAPIYATGGSVTQSMPDVLAMKRPSKRALEDDASPEGGVGQVSQMNMNYVQRKPETPLAGHGLKNINGKAPQHDGRLRPLKKAKTEHPHSNALSMPSHVSHQHQHPHQQPTPTPQGV